MNIIKIILYPSPLAPFFGNEEDLKLRCKLEWPNTICIRYQSQNKSHGSLVYFCVKNRCLMSTTHTDCEI